MSQTVKIYESDSLKIYWRPEICSHAGECVRGLPNVFDVKKRPWVSIQNAATEEITSVINCCPSKALSYEVKNQEI